MLTLLVRLTVWKRISHDFNCVTFAVRVRRDVHCVFTAPALGSGCKPRVATVGDHEAGRKLRGAEGKILDLREREE
jgi:hypothetical protein